VGLIGSTCTALPGDLFRPPRALFHVLLAHYIAIHTQLRHDVVVVDRECALDGDAGGVLVPGGVVACVRQQVIESMNGAGGVNE